MLVDPPILVAAAAEVPYSGTLIDVVIMLLGCVFGGFVMKSLHQSVLAGYLLGGLVLGPGALGIVRDVESFSFMGEIGIALLLFTIGLDLPWRKVEKVGTRALIAGTIQVLLTTAAGTAVALAVGADVIAAIVVGMAVSMSSTAVVLRVIVDRSESESVHGLITTGILLAQDLIVVVFLIIVPRLAATEDEPLDGYVVLSEVGFAAAKLIVLVIAIIVLERIVLRRMFSSEGFSRERELLSIASFVVPLSAIGASWAMGISPALGGFVAGLVMADAQYASQVRSEIAPMRMGLLALFFAYIGMLADLSWMIDHVGWIALSVAGIVVGKSVLAWLAAVIAKTPRFAAIMTGVLLAQIGEFTFAVLAAAERVDIVSDDTFQLLVSASLVTILLTPLLARGASTFLRERSPADWGADERGEIAKGANESDFVNHVIVVGAGPCGRSIVDAVVDNGVETTVIELNPRPTLNQLANHDLIDIVFGDATKPEVLDAAGVEDCSLVVIAVPEPVSSRTIVRQVKRMSPETKIVARGRYNIYIDDLTEAGADHVVDEESITGHELALIARNIMHSEAASGQTNGRDAPSTS